MSSTSDAPSVAAYLLQRLQAFQGDPGLPTRLQTPQIITLRYIKQRWLKRTAFYAWMKNDPHSGSIGSIDLTVLTRALRLLTEKRVLVPLSIRQLRALGLKPRRAPVYLVYM